MINGHRQRRIWFSAFPDGVNYSTIADMTTPAKTTQMMSRLKRSARKATTANATHGTLHGTAIANSSVAENSKPQEGEEQFDCGYGLFALFCYHRRILTPFRSVW